MGSRHPGARACGRGSASCPTLKPPGRHQVWVRSRFRVMWGHIVTSPGDLGGMCLSSWLQVLLEWNMALRGSRLLFPSAFPGLPVYWNVGRLGIFTARIFPSQSDRFQLEPGDSSCMGRACQRGQGHMLGQPQLLGSWGPT